MSANKPKLADLKRLGLRIEAERNRRGFKLKDLAYKAGCGEKTLRNAIAGKHVSGRIIAEICFVLGMNVEEAKPISISDQDHGSYTRDNFSDYIGRYFVYRRSFSFPRNIVRSVFNILWSDTGNVLQFQENQRYDSKELDTLVDHSQSGEIFISNTIGLLHFVTKAKGAIRLITVSKHRLNDPKDLTMQGIVLTQAKRPMHYLPSAAAIIFERISPEVSIEEINKGCCVLRPKDFQYEKYHRALTDVELHVVSFALTPPTMA